MKTRHLLIVCLTVLMVALARDYIELAKCQTEIEWGTRERIARELTEQMKQIGPKVEVPNDKSARPQPEAWKL